MTTPPDTPKPPAELWMLPDPDDGRPRIANEQQIGSVRYILAPSPQESHKLAEELERRCQELAQAHPHHVNGPIHNIAALVMTHRDAILAALRSSPGEQELENIRASHKWCVDLARTVIVTEDRRAIEWYMRNLVDELQKAWQEIEALRSSPSEQNARDAERYRLLRNPPKDAAVWIAGHDHAHGLPIIGLFAGSRADEVVDAFIAEAAIAASGGAQT